MSSSPREGFLLTQRKNLEEIIYLLLKDLKKKLEEKELVLPIFNAKLYHYVLL